MTSMPAVGRRGRPVDSSRGQAFGFLLLAWALPVMAAHLRAPESAHHHLMVVMAFLLWRVWRGVTWSRNLLIYFSVVLGTCAVMFSIMFLLGVPGINARAITVEAMTAATGLVLYAPAVRALGQNQKAAYRWYQE